jgi:hypothetical protein
MAAVLTVMYNITIFPVEPIYFYVLFSGILLQFFSFLLQSPEK